MQYRYNLLSALGLFVMLGVAWLLSANRRKMNWRVIGWGVGLQLFLGCLIFAMPGGTRVFKFLNHAVVRVFEVVRQSGFEFVFGRLAVPAGETNAMGEGALSRLPILFCQAFPFIIFVSALMSVLYFWRIMPLIIKGFAYVFTKVLRVSGAEALCASSNIFVGVESALTIKPHIEKMTQSELCTILTAGMATVASTVLAVYVGFLYRVFPNIAGHLISASLLSAPAALVMSKILVPETGTPETLGMKVDLHYERDGSLFEAVIKGANTGLKLMLGVMALLIAVLGLVAVLDLFIGVLGRWIGWEIEWSLSGFLGYLFYPLTCVLGIPAEDTWEIAQIIGMRSIETEIPGYIKLSGLLAEGTIQPRSAVIATYALCGFAHVASLAIFVGGVAAVAPSRAGDLAKVGFRALIGATLACLMTACVAGIFAGLFGDGSLLLGG